MIDSLTNRDPRWCGEMARIEADEDPRERFLCWQRANYMRLAQVFIAAHGEEFETFTWEMYAQVRRDA